MTHEEFRALCHREGLTEFPSVKPARKMAAQLSKLPLEQQNSLLDSLYQTNPKGGQKIREFLEALTKYKAKTLEDDSSKSSDEPKYLYPETSSMFGTPLEVIGKALVGSYGIVYPFKSLKTGDIRAIKILKKDPKTTHTIGKSNELAGLEKLIEITHQAVVKAYELGQLKDFGTYLAMEYVQGETLSEWIRKHHPISLKQAGEIFLHLLEGMVALVKKNIYHGDIKPDNVLGCKFDDRSEDLDINGIKWVDFGSAWVDGLDNVSGSRNGTRGYMAPERCQYEGNSEASEIFSLGMTCAYILLGDELFSKENQDQLEKLYQTDHHNTKDRLADDRAYAEIIESVRSRILSRMGTKEEQVLRVIVLKCLSYDPAKRYVSIQQLHDDVFDWVDERPIRSGEIKYSARKRWSMLINRAKRSEPRFQKDQAMLVGIGFLLMIPMVLTANIFCTIMIKSGYDPFYSMHVCFDPYAILCVIVLSCLVFASKSKKTLKANSSSSTLKRLLVEIFITGNNKIIEMTLIAIAFVTVTFTFMSVISSADYGKGMISVFVSLGLCIFVGCPNYTYWWGARWIGCLILISAPLLSPIISKPQNYYLVPTFLITIPESLFYFFIFIRAFLPFDRWKQKYVTKDDDNYNSIFSRIP